MTLVIAEAKTRPSGEAKKWHSSNWIRKAGRLTICLRDGFSCAYCGRDLRGTDPREATLDHHVPRCEGGSNHESNLVTARRSCNCSRKDRPRREFAPDGAAQRIEVLVACALNTELARALIEGRAGDADAEFSARAAASPGA